MFGIDLHWMPHCHGSIEVAKILKRLHPRTPVSFGGLSSSIFHEDLIKYDCIDYVFRGDSTEEPMRMLVERIARADRTHTPVGICPTSQPDVERRRGNHPHQPASWVPDDMNAISLDYDYPMKGVLRHHDMTSYLPMKGWLRYPRDSEPHLPRLRGATAHLRRQRLRVQEPLGRRRVVWRSPELLIRDIEHVQNHVWGPIFVLNDFLQAGPEYTREFVCGLKGKVRNPIGFEFFGPPPEATTLPQLDEN